MPDLTLDWFWLALQTAALFVMIGAQLRRRQNRNFYALLIPVAFLILMQGQAWWAFHQFATTGQRTMEQLYNVFDIDAARRANLYVGLGTIAYVLGWWAMRGEVVTVGEPTPVRSYPSPRFPAYLLCAIWTAASAYLLVGQAGGLDLAIAQPGRLIEGGTVFIIAVGLAKWPLIQRIASRQRPRIADVAFWGASTLITLFNSRFLTAFAIIQLLVVLNYYHREIRRRTIAAMVVPALGIFIVFGIYRDYAFRFGTVGTEAAHEFLSRPEEWNVADWFYRTNVEGFTGVAGALAYEHQHPFDYDFGISELNVFTRLVPNSVRNDPSMPFASIVTSLDNVYPYSASVVASGIELANGHLGLAGVLIYCAMLGVLTVWFDRRAREIRPGRLAYLILSAQLLNGVRASLFFSIVFFGLGDLITLTVYRGFLRVDREFDSIGAGPDPVTTNAAP
ncbi:MAG TPA: hypothetical protein VGM82_06965 [Gemmatimonadaceae bacterium]|jgi:hypothetical protein